MVPPRPSGARGVSHADDTTNGFWGSTRPPPPAAVANVKRPREAAHRFSMNAKSSIYTGKKAAGSANLFPQVANSLRAQPKRKW
mmetsp:Transcript_46738/g.136055  ORF Transcript_46738/g.136055 Transcript_46738/m.136055 type:complete len:84 (-) Transcript_46738:742-993(-)